MSRTKKRNKNQASQKQLQAGYFEGSDGQKLFVPTEGMWGRHEISKPPEVLKRANLKKSLWGKWKDNYPDHEWLFDSWLYGGNKPESPNLEYQTRRKGWKREPREGEFFLTEEMMQFRRFASPTCDWLQKKCQNPESGIITHESALYFKKNHLSGCPWFDAWLFRGKDVPSGVQVVLPAEIRRARTAWDYSSLLQDHDRGTYAKWFNDVFPEVKTAAEFFEWMYWLYGGKNISGWFIIPEKIFNLKKRLSLTGIVNAAGVSARGHKGWMRNPTIKESLADALNSAPPMTGLDAWDRRHPELQAHTRRKIKSFVKASMEISALEDTKLSRASWQQYQEKAERIGGRKLRKTLIAYVRSKDDASKRFDAHGEVGLGLFLPPPTMAEFHNAAGKLLASQRISHLRTKYEGCFEQWFLDWTLPRLSSRGEVQWYREILESEQKMVRSRTKSARKNQTPVSIDSALPVLVTREIVAKMVHLSPRSMTPYIKNWPAPYVTHSGERPARWSYQVILPTLLKQFSGITFPEHPPSAL